MAYKVLHEHCHFGVSAPSPSISHMAFHLVAGSVTWISSRISPKNIHGCWTTKWATYLTKWLWKGFGWLGELYQPKMTTSPRPFGNLPKDLQMPGTQGHVHPRTERYWKILKDLQPLNKIQLTYSSNSYSSAPNSSNSSKQKKNHRIIGSPARPSRYLPRREIPGAPGSVSRPGCRRWSGSGPKVPHIPNGPINGPMEGNLHREQFLGDPNDPKIRKMLWKTKINHGISRTCFSKSGAMFEARSTYFNCRQTRLGKNQSAPGVLEWKSWLQRSESTSSRASSSKVEASNPPRDSFEDWPGINKDHKQRTACAYIYIYIHNIHIHA